MTAPAPLTRKVPQPVVEHTETLVIVSSPRDDMCGPTRPATPADLIAFLPLLPADQKAAAREALGGPGATPMWATPTRERQLRIEIEASFKAACDRADAAESALAAMTAERDEARRALAKERASHAETADSRAKIRESIGHYEQARAVTMRERDEAQADRDREKARADALERLREAVGARRKMVGASDNADDPMWRAIWRAFDALPAPSSASAEANDECSHGIKFWAPCPKCRDVRPDPRTVAVHMVELRAAREEGFNGGVRAMQRMLGDLAAKVAPLDYQPAPSETGEASR